jgi:hypothetical protein
LPQKKISPLNDQEGNRIDLYGRSLYSVIGREEAPEFHGQWVLKDVTPFPSQYSWEDVPEEAQVVGSRLLHSNNMHALCVDVDRPLLQLSARQPDGSLVTGIQFKTRLTHNGRESVRNFCQILQDLNLAWNWTPTGNSDLKIWFDRNMGVHVVKSTHNHHLYINSPLAWDDCVAIMAAMVEVDLIDDGYVWHSLRRKECHLRMPGITKYNLDGAPSDKTSSLGGGTGDAIRPVGDSTFRSITASDLVGVNINDTAV